MGNHTHIQDKKIPTKMYAKKHSNKVVGIPRPSSFILNEVRIKRPWASFLVTALLEGGLYMAYEIPCILVCSMRGGLQYNIDYPRNALWKLGEKAESVVKG